MDTRSVKYPQITETDYTGKLVSELDDRPQLLPSELKARFDALGKEVIIPVLNTISENVDRDIGDIKAQLNGLTLTPITRARYDELETKDAHTLYVITEQEV